MNRQKTRQELCLMENVSLYSQHSPTNALSLVYEKPRILLVKNPLNRQQAQMRRWLKCLGFQLDLTESANDAVLKLHQNNYVIVLLVDNPPRINAWLVMRYLQLFGGTETKIILFPPRHLKLFTHAHLAGNYFIFPKTLTLMRLIDFFKRHDIPLPKKRFI
jgi:hypothetical protein